ncbi:hypothetical protein SHIRM173S_13352 [Streptomyces hirsutus]
MVRALSAQPRCVLLDDITEAWDGVPSALWRKRIARHARDCTVCAGFQSGLVPAEGLLVGLGLVPVAAGLLTALGAGRRRRRRCPSRAVRRRSRGTRRQRRTGKRRRSRTGNGRPGARRLPGREPRDGGGGPTPCEPQRRRPHSRPYERPRGQPRAEPRTEEAEQEHRGRGRGAAGHRRRDIRGGPSPHRTAKRTRCSRPPPAVPDPPRPSPRHRALPPPHPPLPPPPRRPHPHSHPRPPPRRTPHASRSPRPHRAPRRPVQPVRRRPRTAGEDVGAPRAGTVHRARGRSGRHPGRPGPGPHQHRTSRPRRAAHR